MKRRTFLKTLGIVLITPLAGAKLFSQSSASPKLTALKMPVVLSEDILEKPWGVAISDVTKDSYGWFLILPYPHPLRKDNL